MLLGSFKPGMALATVGKACKGTVTAVKSEVTSARSRAEAVGT